MGGGRPSSLYTVFYSVVYNSVVLKYSIFSMYCTVEQLLSYCRKLEKYTDQTWEAPIFGFPSGANATNFQPSELRQRAKASNNFNWLSFVG